MKTEVDSPPASRITQDLSRSAAQAFFRYWLPVVLWMALIFVLSTEAGAPRHTSRILRPLLHWLNPDLSEETIDAIQFVIRKAAHVTEYAVLAWLVWRARRKPVAGDTRPWCWSEAAFALGVSALFAASDEWHQSFVPSREAQMKDVLIDLGGALVGLSASWSLGCRRRNGWLP